MDSSSDGSFAWTDASSDRTGSDSKSATETIMTAEREDGGESESGSSYKKNLQKQLFQIKDKTKLQHGKSAKTAKKRKFKEEPLEENEHKPKAKFVKSEPESDIEYPKKKKKKRHDRQFNGDLHGFSVNMSEESYLNVKVKEELPKFLQPNSIKRKKDTMCYEYADEVSSCDDHSKPNKFCEVKDNQLNVTDNQREESNVQLKQDLQDTSRKKVKKKKSKKYEDSTVNCDSMILLEKFSADEGSPEASIETKKHKSSKSLKKSGLSDSVNSVDIHSVKKQNASDNIPNNTLHTSRDSTLGYNNNEDHNGLHSIEDDETPKSFNNESSSLFKENVQRSTRISDRIRFEDEENSELETAHETEIKLLQVEKFRKAKNLKPVSFKLPKQAIVSDNDEIWVLRCPQGIDTDALAGVDLTIDHRCKIKVGGVTYEGSVDTESQSTALLTFDRGAPIIKLVSVNGVVNLRRRVPKPHFVEDKVMVNNQTDFIPLPETKCRHPLFGSDYKRATKLSESLRERLSGVVNMSDEAGSPRKKNKKKKIKRPSAGGNIDKALDKPHVKLEPQVAGVELSQERKRKHDHSLSETIFTKKSKRKKRDHSSAEVWESEKAIEESLFNY